MNAPLAKANLASDTTGLNGWMVRLRDQEMPVFGAIASAIGAIADSDRTAASALGRVVLQDVGMTTRVLKLANSSFFNPRGARVSTVSRAIILLGFDTVRSVALSVALIESLTSNGCKQRVAELMARSLHAAVQAKHIVRTHGETAGEEAFIAALLANLGEMAFWCFSGETGEQVQLLEQQGHTADDAEMTVLGFKLKQLTMSLAREWKLSPIISNLAQGNVEKGSREHGVQLAQRLAKEVERGWETPAARALLKEMASYTGATSTQLQDQLHENAAEAARVARFYGAPEAAKLIPVPSTQSGNADEELDAVEQRVPDVNLQLEVSREMTMHIAQGPQLNTLLDMAMEGIYRGLAADRVVFALVTPNRQQVIGKVVLGEHTAGLQQRFQFLLSGVSRDVIVEVMERHQSFLVAPGQTDLPPLGRLVNAVGDVPCMLAPVGGASSPLGLLYADRASGLSSGDFDGFTYFARLVSLGVETLAARAQAHKR